MRWCWLLVALIACSYSPPGSSPTDGSPSDTGDGPAADDGPAPDVDTDLDGFLDPEDNCPAIANANQADEDADAIGNACDNCPHIANADQANTGELDAAQTADTVGDACDPEPSVSGNSIALFMPFVDPTEIDTWTGGGTNAAFSISGGKLRQTGATDLAILFKNGLGLAEAFITTNVTYDTIDENQQFQGVAIMTRFVRNGNFGFGVGCGEMSDNFFNGGAAFFNLMRFDNGGFQHTSRGSNAVIAAGHTARYSVHHVTGTTHECAVVSTSSLLYSGTLGLAEGDGTGINFAVYGSTVSFDYLIAIL